MTIEREIQANELRIGNYVYDVDYWAEPKTFTPYKIEGDDISRAAINGVRFEPIPLTLELFIRIGLKMTIYGHDGERNLSSWGNRYLTIIDTMSVWVNNEEVPHIKYLHQLQNLYRALTGEELEINF